MKEFRYMPVFVKDNDKFDYPFIEKIFIEPRKDFYLFEACEVAL